MEKILAMMLACALSGCCPRYVMNYSKTMQDEYPEKKSFSVSGKIKGSIKKTAEFKAILDILEYTTK